MIEVSLDGIIIIFLQYFLSLPPNYLRKKKNFMFFFHIFAASIIFLLFPEVVIPIATSPLLPIHQLVLKNFIKIEVISYSCQCRSICCKRDCWQCLSIFFESYRNFCCEMLRICSTSSIFQKRIFLFFFIACTY